MPFYPGPGLGGHCIPIDPFYLTWKAREFEQHTRFIELAGEINTAMPAYVVERTAEALNAKRKPVNGSRILVVGLAYKPNVDDDRESPSYIYSRSSPNAAPSRLLRPIRPVIRPSRDIRVGPERNPFSGTKATIGSFDVVFISTAHSVGQSSAISRLVAMHCGPPGMRGGQWTPDRSVWKA